MDNQDMLSKIQGALKAITTTTLGDSVLTPEKRDRFIRVVSESTRMLDDARQITMNSHTHDIDRVGFGSRIMTAGTEGTDPGGSTDPDFNTNTLTSVEGIAIASITDSSLEDNIEKQGFEDTLTDLIASRVGVDLEELFVQGDTSLTGYLALTNGWLNKAANAITGASDYPTTGDFLATDVESMFNRMLSAVPKKYLRDRSQWKYYVHWDVENDYRDVLRERGTGLGDTAQTSAQPVAFKGIAVQESANMPVGRALLVPSNNLVYGLYRDIRIEPERHARTRTTDFVASLRADCHYEDENAAVVASGYTGP